MAVVHLLVGSALVFGLSARFGQADNVFHVPLHVRAHTHTHSNWCVYVFVCARERNTRATAAERLISRQRVAFVCDVLCGQLIDVDCDAGASAFAYLLPLDAKVSDERRVREKRVIVVAVLFGSLFA